MQRQGMSVGRCGGRGCRITLACAALGVACGAAADEGGPRLLSDAELDAVAAGTVAVNESEETLVFSAVKETAAGRTVRAEGELKIIEMPRGLTVGTLTLTDGAQQNLQSLININAVNSAINVLLNLNVTIDSSVGAINQLNLTESLPRVPVSPPGH